MIFTTKTFVIAFLFICAFTLNSFECGQRPAPKHGGGSPGGDVREEPGPVTVTVAEPKLAGNRLTFGWEIKNTGADAVYVYATFLEYPDIAEIVTSPETRVVEVRFLQLEPLPFAPYYFPKPTFLEIPPGQVRQGRFISKEDVRRILHAAPSNKNGAGEATSQGPWKVRAVIAFGRETASVRRRLAELEASGVRYHPVNPVVEWQKTASSEPVALRL